MKESDMFTTIEEGMKFLEETVVQRSKYKSLDLFDKSCQISVQLIQLGADPKEVMNALLP